MQYIRVVKLQNKSSGLQCEEWPLDLDVLVTRAAEFIKSSFPDLNMRALSIFTELSCELLLVDCRPMSGIIQIYNKHMSDLISLLETSHQHQRLGLELLHNTIQVLGLQEAIGRTDVFDFLFNFLDNEEEHLRAQAVVVLHHLTHNPIIDKKKMLCRSSEALLRLLDISQSGKEHMHTQALRTIAALSLYEDNKIKIAQVGVIFPLFALAISDLRLEEVKQLIPAFCRANDISVQSSTVLALLSLTKTRKYLEALNTIRLHRSLLQLLLRLEERDLRLTTNICSLIARLATRSDEVKRALLRPDIKEHLLRLMSSRLFEVVGVEFNDESSVFLLGEVVALFGCALLSPSFVGDQALSDFQCSLRTAGVIDLWKQLLLCSQPQLRHRCVNILRLLTQDAEGVQKILERISLSQVKALSPLSDAQVGEDLILLATCLEDSLLESESSQAPGD